MPFLSDDINESLLGRYIAGHATADERARVDTWADKNHEHRAVLRDIELVWRVLPIENERADITVAWEHVRERLAALTEQWPEKRPQQFGTPELSGSLSRNALLREQFARHQRSHVGGLLGTRTLRGLPWFGGLAALLASVILARHIPETRADVTRTYATNAQQQAVVDLDDGTQVTLAPGTTLYLRHFGARSRTVTLDKGEAYFNVAHTSGVPFIVRSGGAMAQVLGTAFLVRRSADVSRVHVAVTDGKVRVMIADRAGARAAVRPDAGVTLTSGQAGEVTDSTTAVSTSDDLPPGTEWAPGRIIFHHTPLATVLHTVSQWYGYQFRYADSTLRTRSVTMMVSTRSSAEALATIEQILAVNLTVVGDTVTLVPQPLRSKQNVPRIRTYDVWTPTREVGR